MESVIMAMSNYIMSCFKLPRGLCKEISARLARFWWGGGNRKEDALGQMEQAVRCEG